MPLPPATDPGPFLSLLDWLEGAGEVPMNLLAGRGKAAGRKLVDTLTAIPDSVMPGNAIAEVSTPEDDITGSELVGVDRAAHPGLAKAVDIGVGTALNPFSYLGARGGTVKAGLPLTEGTEIAGAGNLVAKAKAAVATGVNKLPESMRKSAAATGQSVRRALNWLDVAPEQEAILRQSRGKGYEAARAATEEVERIYKPLTLAEREAAGELAHGINRQGTTDRTKWTLIDDPDAYLGNRSDIRADVVRQAAADRLALMETLAAEGNAGGVMNVNPGFLPQNYIQRQFSGSYFDDAAASPFNFRDTPSAPNPMRKRAKELSDPKGLLRFMQDTPDVDLEFNALTADMKRSAQQGRLIERGALGKAITKNDQFTLADTEHRTAMDAAIKDLERSQPDFGYKLRNAFDGTEPRGDSWFAKGLHMANKTFKGAATYGVIVPRLGFNVRNRVGGLWQALSNDEARKTVGKSAGRALSDLMGAVDDGFVKLTGSKRVLKPSELTSALDHIDAAFKNSRGSTAKFREQLAAHPDGKYLQEALDNGVLDNFVDSEELLTRLARTPKGQRVKDIMQWPAAIGQGLEQRMRLGTFLDLRKGGVAKDAKDAAQTIRDTYLDYSTPGNANRTFRDIVPFGAFLSQNVKQQSKFIARHPVAGVATAQLFGDDEGLPKYPWLDQQMAIPLGADEEGNAQYLSSLGLPVEGLTAIPGLSPDDAYRDVVGSLQPALKSAIAWAADKEPFTGSDFGTYDKLFGEHAGPIGRAVNIAEGTGIPQVLANPVAQAENLLDSRKSIGERALQQLTGARFVSVDPDVAERQRIEDFLKQRPDIGRAQLYYQREKDGDLGELLKDLSATKARLAQKKAAAASL